MSVTFGVAAARHAGLAARALGWRPAEFWTATPAELAACLAPPGDVNNVPVDRCELQRLIASDDEGGSNERPG